SARSPLDSPKSRAGNSELEADRWQPMTVRFPEKMECQFVVSKIEATVARGETAIATQARAASRPAMRDDPRQLQSTLHVAPPPNAIAAGTPRAQRRQSGSFL